MALLGPVGPDRHQVRLVLVGRRDVQQERVPQAEQDPAVGQHGRIEHGARIESQLLDPGSVAVGDPQRLGPLLVVLFQITRAVADKHDPAIGQIDAGDVVEGAVGQLDQSAAVGLDLVQVEPILPVAAHAEQDLAAVIGRLRVEHLAFGQLRDPAERAARAGRNQRVQVPAGASRRGRPFQRMLRGRAMVHVPFAPMTGAVPRHSQRFVPRAEDLVGDEDDARQALLAPARGTGRQPDDGKELRPPGTHRRGLRAGVFVRERLSPERPASRKRRRCLVASLPSAGGDAGSQAGARPVRTAVPHQSSSHAPDSRSD